MLLVDAMQDSKVKLPLALLILLLIQTTAPLASALVSPPLNSEIVTSADLTSLNMLGVAPSGLAENGWVADEFASGQVNLLYRDANLLSVEDWASAIGSSTISGWYVLSHSYPVPSEWFGQLADAGIECQSFLPPTSFNCKLNGHKVSSLENLEVEGIMQLDSTDKIRDQLAIGLSGGEMDFFNPYVNEYGALVNIVLSGNELPEGIYQREDIELDSHSTRYATLAIEASALPWLAQQD